MIRIFVMSLIAAVACAFVSGYATAGGDTGYAVLVGGCAGLFSFIALAAFLFTAYERERWENETADARRGTRTHKTTELNE